jgi:TRAP-type C4-dicarboxylate transport system permease small subunit
MSDEAPPPWLRRYDAVLDLFDKVASFIVIVSMGVLTTVVVLQVFFRYVLNDSLSWGWDIPRLCFIWVIMFSIPLGIRYNAHVGIDLVVERFSNAGRRHARRINAVFMLVLSAVAAIYGVQLMYQTWDQLMPGIALSVGLFYLGLVYGQLHTVLHIFRIFATGETLPHTLSET